MILRFIYSFAFISIFLLVGQESAQSQFLSQPRPEQHADFRSLFIPHAAIDPVSGDFLIVSNTWRYNNTLRLRRFDPDGNPKENFRLQRFESCCEIQPSLVAVNKVGEIFTIQYIDNLSGFNIFKHSPEGELIIDWGSDYYLDQYGFRRKREVNPDVTGKGWEAGETSLGRVASGGVLNQKFDDPVDLIPRDDGSVLLLDRFARYVYRIVPDGTTAEKFIGNKGYIPVKPQRLLQDSDGYLYLVDETEYDDFANRSKSVVRKFSPDGELIFRWGEGADTINDNWISSMDFGTMVIDGLGNIIVLGGEKSGWNHSEMYVFDRETGQRLSRNLVQNRQGYDQNYAGMLPRNDGGFIHLEAIDFILMLNYYSLDGKLEKTVKIDKFYYLD